MMGMIVMVGCSGTLSQEELDEALAIELLDQITLVSSTTSDLLLATTITKEGIDYELSWESSHKEIINSSGTLVQPDVDTTVSLTASVTVGSIQKSKVFTIIAYAYVPSNPFVASHQFIDRASEFDLRNRQDLKVVDNRVVLSETSVSATHISKEFTVTPFKSMVASWAAISSATSTAEVQVRVRVDGVWSKYFSYRPWGLGLNNASWNTADTVAKISIDEIIILDSKLADAFQYKLILSRANITVDSPAVSLVATTFDIPNYTYQVNIDDLPDFLDYDVPMRSQQEVPVIGSSICSPTSSAMLLQYKGHDFSEDDELAHRYLAGLFRDYGAKIYGNWVYNTVGMSAYGEDSYVGRMYSFEELRRHLKDVGPVAASVSGDLGIYTTGGHLIVVRGYRITDTGDTFVIVNDPNINDRFGNDISGEPLFVYYEFPLEVFMRVWKGIVYIVE